MTDRFDLYGFAYPVEAGAKTRSPILKKCGIRCMVQDAKNDLITWYYQRQELINKSLFLIDLPDFALIAINDRIVYEGTNYRVKGRYDLAGRKRVFRVDVALEIP
jgi:hypothetical protein